MSCMHSISLGTLEDGITHQVVSTLALTWLIRYVYIIEIYTS